MGYSSPGVALPQPPLSQQAAVQNSFRPVGRAFRSSARQLLIAEFPNEANTATIVAGRLHVCGQEFSVATQSFSMRGSPVELLGRPRYPSMCVHPSIDRRRLDDGRFFCDPPPWTGILWPCSMGTIASTRTGQCPFEQTTVRSQWRTRGDSFNSGNTFRNDARSNQPFDEAPLSFQDRHFPEDQRRGS